MATEPQVSPANRINVLGSAPHIFPDRGGDGLHLRLGEFDGPLDLLLYLIRREQVSIYDIPVARITDEYLQCLRAMHRMDITVAADFVVMAATLIEIKSRMLLPIENPASDQNAEADDPRQELIERLVEYEKYKAAAQMLWSRATVEQAVFARAPLESDTQNPEVRATPFDLFRTFQQILSRRTEETIMEIEREKVTMAEMITVLRNMILSSGEVNLRRFFCGMSSRRELVVAFLALLELVRAMEIVLIQPRAFGDIVARVNG